MGAYNHKALSELNREILRKEAEMRKIEKEILDMLRPLTFEMLLPKNKNVPIPYRYHAVRKWLEKRNKNISQPF